MKIFAAFLLGLVGSVALGGVSWAQTEPESDILTIRHEGKPVVEYLSATSAFKPYARQLFSPAGVNVVRDNVPDHLHHHGLMFAWKVDGVNFWEEVGEAGYQFDRGHRFERGRIVQSLEWTKPDKKEPLLVERRTIELEKSPDSGAHLLTWQAVFSVPEGKDSATITGSHYNGLGMRFLASTDCTGSFIGGDDKTSAVVATGDVKEQLAPPAPWCAYTASMDGNPVTVALFDSPANPRPATFFLMSQPFSYLSATLALHQEPLVLQRDKPMTLTYGIALWDGAIDPAQIARLYQAWRAAH